MNTVEINIGPNSTMLVSIVIPTYNSTDTIVECISSIRNQNYKGNYEIVVVDNGSNDDTVTKLNRIGIKNVIISPDTTVYGSRNIGVKKSKGEILVFLDSDCIAFDEWLSSGVKMLDYSDVVAGKIVPKNTDKSFLYYYDKYILCHARERDIKNVNIAAGNAFIKRKVFENLYGFRDDIVTAGDSIFSMMAKKNGYKVVFCENAIVSHPVDTMSKKLRGLFREGAGAQIKSPYKYEKDKIRVKIKKRIMQMIIQYKDDLSSINTGRKKGDITIYNTIKLVIFSVLMRTLMYLSIILYIYFRPISKLLSRR